MSDSQAFWKPYSQLTQPDGSVFMYVQAAMDLNQGDYIEQLPTGRVKKFSGGVRLPKAIILETVPKDHFTWTLVKEPDARPEPQREVVTEESIKRMAESKPIVG